MVDSSALFFKSISQGMVSEFYPNLERQRDAYAVNNCLRNLEVTNCLRNFSLHLQTHSTKNVAVLQYKTVYIFVL